jgi:hypothetical protein
MPKQEPTEAPEESDVPASKESQAVAARQEQSKAAKRATFDQLLNKPRRTTEIEILLPSATGKMEDRETVSFKFVALGSVEYDKLVTKHPPTTDQRAEGANYNIDTFGPDLLSRVCVDPEFTKAQWAELWTSPDWNRGEIIDLFSTAAGLCMAGLEVPLS